MGLSLELFKMVILATKNFKSFYKKWNVIVITDQKSQIRNRITAEGRELTVEKENEIREESFKKRHFKRSRDGYGQPKSNCYLTFNNDKNMYIFLMFFKVL